MPYHRSSYVFITQNDKRTFHHRWHMNGQVYECDACGSTCSGTDAFSKHWQLQQQVDYNNNVHPHPHKKYLTLSQQVKQQVEMVDALQINTFLLCHQNFGIQGFQEFLLEAGINAVPELLRLLFYQAQQLRIQIAFYVTILKRDFLFESSELPVRHHFDVGESVDMIFSMLLEKIRSYIIRQGKAALEHLDDYEVKRIRIKAKRLKAFEGQERTLCGVASGKGGEKIRNIWLPLQYRLKRATRAVNDGDNADDSIGVGNAKQLKRVHTFPTAACDSVATASTCPPTTKAMPTISVTSAVGSTSVNASLNQLAAAADENALIDTTKAYVQHLLDANLCVPSLRELNVNLFCFQICHNSRELYVVPYHISSSNGSGGDTESTKLPQSRSFIILDDVTGEFQQLHEITNLRRFLRHDATDRVLTCSHCQATFMEHTKLTLHKQLLCGREFHVEEIDTDSVEIYERCFSMRCERYPWALYGVVES